MITKQTVAKFYEDIERLGLKFPVAEVARKTGFTKGNVSSYLSRKSEPSENFLNEFYRQFQNSLKEVPRETRIDNIEEFLTGNQVRGIALLQVILEILAEQEARATGNSITKILSDYASAVKGKEAILTASIGKAKV